MRRCSTSRLFTDSASPAAVIALTHGLESLALLHKCQSQGILNLKVESWTAESSGAGASAPGGKAGGFMPACKA